MTDKDQDRIYGEIAALQTQCAQLEGDKDPVMKEARAQKLVRIQRLQERLRKAERGQGPRTRRKAEAGEEEPPGDESQGVGGDVVAGAEGVRGETHLHRRPL